MSLKIKNQNGFSLVEGLLILILVSVIGFAGYYVYTQQTKNDDTHTAASAAGKKAASNNDPDPLASWKTYTDSKDKVSFKYPGDWKINIEKIKGSELGFEGDNDYLSGSITSPSGKVELSYANFVTGLGGGSCPDDFPCPYVDILALKDVPGAKSVKYVEKITYWKGNGDGYMPSLGLIGVDKAAKLKVGEFQDNDFYMTANWGDDGSIFAKSFSPNADPSKGFKTRAEAQAFLDSTEAKQAKQILLSFTQ